LIFLIVRSAAGEVWQHFFYTLNFALHFLPIFRQKYSNELNISKSAYGKNNFIILDVAKYLSYVFTEFKEQIRECKRTNHPKVTR